MLSDQHVRRWSHAFVFAGLTAVAAAGPVRADTPATAKPPIGTGTVPPGRRPVDTAAVAALIAQGQAALTTGTYDVARTAFAAAVAASPSSGPANRGLGFALVRLGDPTHAVAPLKAALKAAGDVPDRSVALALSAAYVAAGSPLPGIKVVTDYLNAHATPLDEPMVNALGVAMDQANRSNVAKLSPVFKQGADVYSRENTALEAQRPGMKRWGTIWLKRRVYESRESAYQGAKDAVKALVDSIADLTRQGQDAVTRQHQNATKLGFTNRWAQIHQIHVDEHLADDTAQKLTTAKGQMAVAQHAMQETPSPSYPAAVATDTLDLTVDPASGKSNPSPTAGTIWADAGATAVADVPDAGPAPAAAGGPPPVVHAAAAAAAGVPWSSASDHVGERVTYTGTVVAAERRRDGLIYLSLGGDFRAPSRLVITMPYDAAFAPVPAHFIGRTVSVAGAAAQVRNAYRISLTDGHDVILH